jgi:hypothetical protein
MSRQNKVNPAHYTQRGRLTQDDAARELARQRSIGSQHTWQPVKKDNLPRLASNQEDADRDAEQSEGTESLEAEPSRGKARSTARMARKSGGQTAILAKAKPSRSAKTSTVKKTSDVGRVPRSGPGAISKAKTGTAAKATVTKTTRKAVLARSVGGPALKPVRTPKRRKR